MRKSVAPGSTGLRFSTSAHPYPLEKSRPPSRTMATVAPATWLSARCAAVSPSMNASISAGLTGPRRPPRPATGEDSVAAATETLAVAGPGSKLRDASSAWARTPARAKMTTAAMATCTKCSSPVAESNRKKLAFDLPHFLIKQTRLSPPGTFAECILLFFLSQATTKTVRTKLSGATGQRISPTLPTMTNTAPPNATSRSSRPLICGCAPQGCGSEEQSMQQLDRDHRVPGRTGVRTCVLQISSPVRLSSATR
jgi:hypothetical protein